MEEIIKKILNWLTGCPASDINFKSNLNNANIETCKEALKDNGLSKLARQKIESRIKKLEKHLNLTN